MSATRRWFVPIAILAILTGVGATAAAAGQSPPASSPTPAASSADPSGAGAETVVFGRKLKTTAISQSSDIVTVPAGFQAIDGPTTISCPGTTGTTCTFEADQNVQVGGSTANNRWAVCTTVDGMFMAEPNCPFLGLVTTTGYAAGSFVQTMTGISPGSHTVQTLLYTDFGAARSIYTIVYRVYKP